MNENNYLQEVFGIKEVFVSESVGNSKMDRLMELFENDVANCEKCRLAKGRNNIVFGEGNPEAELMFVGEGPGAEEDKQGRPFVGRAGQLLTKMIEAMKFKREEVYIANIVKCRPPGNRAPFQDEIEVCIPYLHKQIEIISPKAIICLGSVAASSLLNTTTAISKIRGEFREFKGIKVMPTFHPAYLLRNPKMKKPAWEDLQKVMKLLGKL